jgi:hypothetical protein
MDCPSPVKRRDFQELCPASPEGSQAPPRGWLPGGRSLSGRICGGVRSESVHREADSTLRVSRQGEAIAIHTHNLEKLVQQAELGEVLKDAKRTQPELNANWDMVAEWWEQSRYERPSRADAEELRNPLIKGIRKISETPRRWLECSSACSPSAASGWMTPMCTPSNKCTPVA